VVPCEAQVHRLISIGRGPCQCVDGSSVRVQTVSAGRAEPAKNSPCAVTAGSTMFASLVRSGVVQPVLAHVARGRHDTASQLAPGRSDSTVPHKSASDSAATQATPLLFAESKGNAPLGNDPLRQCG